MMTTKWTLWYWSAKEDDWQWITEAIGDDPDKRAVILRGHRRRNPRGARLKWKQGADKPKRFRARRKA